MDKGGNKYLIEKKTLWEEEKLLVLSNFSLSHFVFKSFLLLMCQNEYLWSKVFVMKYHGFSENPKQNKRKNVRHIYNSLANYKILKLSKVEVWVN